MFGDLLTGSDAWVLPTWAHWLIGTALVMGVLVAIAVALRPARADVLTQAVGRMGRRAGRLASWSPVAGTFLRGSALRLGLVVSGLAAGLVVAEVSLQTIAFARRAIAPAPGKRTSGRPVLAVGDSNTYGLYLSPGEQAYPPLLERLWNAQHPTEPVEVVNAGYPGTNSSIVLEALPELLARLHPSVVTIMVGVNDFWTEPITGPSVFRRLRRWSRVYPLLIMLARWVDPPTPRFQPMEGVPVIDERSLPLVVDWRDTPTGDWVAALRNNLLEMILLVREAGAVPVLLTYAGEAPSHKKDAIEPTTYLASAAYMTANAAIRASARTLAARLIDVDAVFHTRCARPDCNDLLFPDLHPRAAGYQIIAETLVKGWDGWGVAATSALPGTNAPPRPRS